MPALTLADVTLYYVERGTGSPLVLIHGTQPDADVWGPTFAELSARHRVIAYDRRGYSLSLHAPERDFRTHAADAAMLVEQLVGVPAAILGWSWGAVVAMELAAQRPDLVEHLVLVEPAVHLKKHPTLSVILAVARTQYARILRGNAAAAKTFLDWACRDGSGRGLERFPDASRRTVAENATVIVAEIAAGTGETLTEGRIASIACPATVISGSTSDVAFQRAAQRLTRLLPQCRTIRIAAAGHAVHFDQPEAFVQNVLEAVATPE
jgi:pimeloyl-ACP methyl ester carboxylesterase